MFQMSDFTLTIDSCLCEDVAHHIYFDKSPLIEIEQVLDEPCNMGYILLCSNYYRDTYRTLNVRGLTNREVCEKVYTFYKHKTIRKMMGDHIWLEGWFEPVPGVEDMYKPCNYGS